MWKWPAIGIGVLSVLIAFLLLPFWADGEAGHALASWLLGALLAAQLTALVLRKWRSSLLAALAATTILYADMEWFGPCSDGCTMTATVAAPPQ